MKKPRPISRFIKELYHIWITERPTTLAASLAYYAIFSFVPAIFIALTIAGLFIDTQALASSLLSKIQTTLGPEAARYLQDSVINLSQNTSGEITVSSVIGFIAMFMAASMMFFQLQFALNSIWKVPPAEKKGTLALIKGRLLAFLMVLGLALLVFLSALANVIISLVRSYVTFGNSIPMTGILIFLGLLTLSCALIYKLLPEVEIAWRDVWIGSLVTTFLITLGSWLLGLYFRASSFTSAMDAAGAVAVFLVAFYIFAQIFLFGAVFTRVYAEMFGSKIVPRD